MVKLKPKPKQRIPLGIILCLCVFAIHSSRPEEFDQIPGRRAGTASLRARTTNLTPQQIYQDLDQFQTELEERFAYLKVIDADYQTAIQSIRVKAANGMILDEFGLELEKVLALFIDCHAGISGYAIPEGCLPFQMEPIENRVIAFWMDRSDFLDPAFPFITRIDGKSMDEWEQIIKLVLPTGTRGIIVDIRHNRGGSGAFIATTLKNSGLTLRLSSMASFQNTGFLFDSRGVLPDIFMEPPPEYYLQGGPDPVLERAVQIILDTEPQNIKRAKIKR